MFNKSKLFLESKYNFYIEKYSKKFGLDLNYFINNGFWSIITLLISTIFGLILSYFIANYFSEEITGKYYFILSIAAIFGIFTFTGLTTIMTNNFLKNKYESYLHYTNFKIKISLIGSFILLILAIITKFLFNLKLWPYLILLSIYIPTLNFNIYFRYLYSNNRFKKISIISIIKNILTIIPTIILIINSYSLIIIIGYYLLIQNLFDIIFFYILKPNNQKKLKITKNEFKNGFLFTIKDSISIISSYLDKFILPIFFDLKVLAIYAIVLIIPKSINSIFNKLYFYLFYKKLNKNKFEFKSKKFYFFIFSNILFSIILIIIIPYIFQIMYPKYLNSIIYAQILIGIIPLNLLNILFFKYFESKNLATEILKINIFVQITQIILYFILIPIYSIFGAIVVKIIKALILVIYFIYIVLKKQKKSLST